MQCSIRTKTETVGALLESERDNEIACASRGDWDALSRVVTPDRARRIADVYGLAICRNSGHVRERNNDDVHAAVKDRLASREVLRRVDAVLVTRVDGNLERRNVRRNEQRTDRRWEICAIADKDIDARVIAVDVPCRGRVC